MIGTSFTATEVPGFIGDGSALTNVPSSSIILNNPNYAVITDGTNNLTTEQFLAPVRGGFGLNPTTLSGSVVVTAGVIGSVPVSNINTASSIVQRDASGNFSAGNVTVTTLTETPNPNGLYTLRSAYVATVNTTATPLFTLATTSGGTNGTAYLINAFISLGNVTTGLDTGTFTFQFKAKNIGGTLTLSNIVNQISILDTGLILATVSVATATTNVLIQVTGIAATTIQWCGKFDITQVNF